MADGSTPMLYLRIAGAITARIADGTYPPSRRLTTRRTLRELREFGLLETSTARARLSYRPSAGRRRHEGDPVSLARNPD